MTSNRSPDELEGPRLSPSDEAVHAYVTDGGLRRYVEGMAAQDPVFAEELAAWIDAVAGARGPRCLAARRWRAGCSLPAPLQSPRTYEVAPALFALAAASPGADPPAREVLALGPLPDFPAEATLEVAAGRVQLFVFPSAPLTSVALGGTVSARADDERLWSVGASLGAGPLRIRLEAADGRVFEEEVEIAPGPE